MNPQISQICTDHVRLRREGREQAESGAIHPSMRIMLMDGRESPRCWDNVPAHAER